MLKSIIMKTSAEIRELFLDFFEKKHQSARIKSSSLIPNNPTILLTTAGMVQFVPYFLGLETPPFDPHRAVSCQKCARAGGKDSDIENVGRTPRHHTFFEMLGNFSFGDYYKEEVIPWAWDFVTNYLGLDKSRLWITVFENDDEAIEIWKKAGVSADRILRKGKKDNFWGPPGASGPCGPCSEIHYDLGEHLACSDDCSIATCECDRWVEIWNLVFTELFQDEEGNQSPLEKKNVDTGMGLERITMVCQGVNSTFETDLLYPILEEVCKISGKKYKENPKTDISLRIITDHLRCVSFMMADGIKGSNEGRGYVLRMILRRALRHGYLLGLELPFLAPLVDKVVEIYGDFYPELKENQEKIKALFLEEEERFKLTLKKGWKHIEEIIAQIKAEGADTISGEEAFKLYDTYGFPMELTREIGQEQGLKVDEEGFKNCMQEQKERARASAQKTSVANDIVYVDYPETTFVGYSEDECVATVVGLVRGLNKLTEVEDDEPVDLILDKTPFYAECGGQVGDTGIIVVGGNEYPVFNTFKVQKTYVHQANGNFKVGDKVTAKINAKRRRLVEKHHSLAHFLQAALIKVLGDEVHQAGSQVEENRCRYDFSFNRAMTEDEISRVEEIINSWILEEITQHTDVMKLEEAKKSGAIALFDEKYEDDVRVVCFEQNGKTISKELCGGTHTSESKNLGLVKIISESAISQGTRRIEAVCSKSAFDYLAERYKEIEKISKKYKIRFNEVDEKISTLQAQNHELTQKIGAMEAQNAKNQFNTFISRAREVEFGGISAKIFVSLIEEFPQNAIKAGIELLHSKLGDSFVFLVSKKADGSAIVFASATDSMVAAGINSGKILSEFVKNLEGRGGGRPNAAQGTVKTTENIEKYLKELEESF